MHYGARWSPQFQLPDSSLVVGLSGKGAIPDVDGRAGGGSASPEKKIKILFPLGLHGAVDAGATVELDEARSIQYLLGSNESTAAYLLA